MSLIDRNKKLDTVLKCLYMVHFRSVNHSVIEPLPTDIGKNREQILQLFMEESDLIDKKKFVDKVELSELIGSVNLILEYLVEDGSVKKTGEDYMIKWRGMQVFIDGGYTAIEKNKAEEKTINEIYKKSLRRGTWAAGIGGCVLAAIEIVKFFYANFCEILCFVQHR